ncbi:MAG: hypothetical protein U0235_14120 [Polyangiaceae bacterium]
MSLSRVSLFAFSFAPVLAAFAAGCEGTVISTASNTGSDSGTDASVSTGADAATDGGSDVTRLDADGGKATTCPGAKEGDACAKEGEHCSPSPCTDPCQFCNSLVCTGGKWQGMEAFPMACFPCGGKQCKPTEYCLAFHAGVAFADGGTPPPTYSCELLANCGPGCSCATASAKGKGQCDPGSCSVSGGGPTVDCYGL